MKFTKLALEAIYLNSPATGELSALDRLMSDRVLSAIKADEESLLRHEKNYDQKIYVDMIWIDKIPLARFCNSVADCNGRSIKSKVEIGDLVIQRTRSQLHSEGSAHVISNRSLVVQAKVTKDAPAIVPIASIKPHAVTSTTKELALLQHWPKLDLYATSRSKKPLLENIKIDEGRPHSFYGGFNTRSQAWTFGRARMGEECQLEFYDLLQGLTTQNLGEVVTGSGTWSQLMGGVLSAASNRTIPKYLNSILRDRVQGIEASIAGFDFGALVDCLRPKRMAVLMIDQVDFEGHKVESLQSSFPSL
jgi:hypothetical protein